MAKTVFVFCSCEQNGDMQTFIESALVGKKQNYKNAHEFLSYLKRSFLPEADRLLGRTETKIVNIVIG